MPEPYTESFTGTVARVWPGDAQHAHQIIMREPNFSTVRFYTWSDWAGTFFQQAAESQRVVTLDFSRTSWGRLITDQDYAAPEEKAAS